MFNFHFVCTLIHCTILCVHFYVNLFLHKCISRIACTLKGLKTSEWLYLKLYGITICVASCIKVMVMSFFI
jgi:hypothetical protein